MYVDISKSKERKLTSTDYMWWTGGVDGMVDTQPGAVSTCQVLPRPTSPRPDGVWNLGTETKLQPLRGSGDSKTKYD